MFAKEISDVVPKNLALEKAAFEDTFYGHRTLQGERFAVGREDFSELAVRLVGGKRVLKKRADIETHRIVDARIRSDVEAFLDADPVLRLEAWDAWCGSYRRAGNGPRVAKVMVTKSKADSLEEYKDVSKDGTGQLRRGAKHRGYFVHEQPAPTLKYPDRKQVEARPVYVHESKQAVAAGITGRICGYLESGCLVGLNKAVAHRKTPLAAGQYLLNTIRSDGFVVLTSATGQVSQPIGIAKLLAAGFRRLR